MKDMNPSWFEYKSISIYIFIGPILSERLMNHYLYHFSLLKNEFQKPKKLKESP